MLIDLCLSPLCFLCSLCLLLMEIEISYEITQVRPLLRTYIDKQESSVIHKLDDQAQCHLLFTYSFIHSMLFTHSFIHSLHGIFLIEEHSRLWGDEIIASRCRRYLKCICSSVTSYRL